MISDTEKRILNDFSEWCSVNGQWDVTDLNEALESYLARPEPNEGEVWVLGVGSFDKVFAVLHNGKWLDGSGFPINTIAVPLFKYESPEDLF